MQDPRVHASGEEKTYVYKHWARQFSFWAVAVMFAAILWWHNCIKKADTDLFIKKSSQVSNARAAMFTSMFVGITLKAVEPFDCTKQVQ